MAEPRPSTDEESASLLRRGENGHEEHADHPTLYQKLVDMTSQPFTTLAKLLLVICLFLLLLSSIFIGLFAGAQHRVNKIRHAPPVSEPTTVSVTTTREFPVTLTETEISTSISATTVVSTITAPAPPVPTLDPRTVPCTSTECIILAASLLSSLDTSKDPCEDFYLYTTGRWLEEHPIPSDKGSYGTFEDVANRNTRVLKEILEIPDTDSLDIFDARSLHKLKDHYQACLDENTMDELGIAPLLDVVAVVKQLFNGSTSIEPHIAEWRMLALDPEMEDDDEEADDHGESENHQVLLHGKDREEKRREKERKEKEKREERERKKKEKQDRKEHKKKEKEEKKRQKEERKQLIKEAEKAKREGLTAAVAYMHSRGIPALFQFDIDGDIGTDPNALTLWFNQPDLGLPSKEYYEEKEIRELYRSTIEQMLLVLMTAAEANEADRRWPPWPFPPYPDPEEKPENKTTKAARLARQVLKFETDIASATADLDALEDPVATYNPMSFSTLVKKIPEIDFQAYIATFAPRSFPSTVIVTYPKYIHRLSTILSSASAETIEAYLVARTTLTLAPRLGTGSEAWKINRRLVEVLNGLKKGAVGDRSEWCVRAVDDALGYAGGRFFVAKTFAGDSKRQASDLISNIVNAFKTSLPYLDWMDKNSSTAAAEKASQIRVKVGYPMTPNTESSYSIWQYYSNIQISNNTFFANALRADTAEQVRKWQKLGKRRDPGSWEMWAQTVNAYFNPPANEIVFPAGILREPWFDQQWPGYLKYAAAGGVISHELTHAFDSSGRKFDQEGKLSEWWTNSTSDKFDEISQCISRQYSEYTIDDGKGNKVHVNGNLTSGENIADAGMIQAFRAWKAQYNTSYDLGQEYLLPGLNYTREQLFFIAYGRTWARNIRPAAALQRVRTDPHSPTQYRVEGTLANIPEFAKAFNCPVGTKLNPPPEKQCRLWV